MKRAEPEIKTVFAEIVYEKDKFVYTIKHGAKIVTEHLQSMDNVDDTKIKGAYATILYMDGTEVSDYMSMAQIQKSWSKSPSNQGVHKEFPTQMAKRTVLARLAGMTLRTGTTDLLLDNDQFAEDFDERADEQEATQTIDITPVIEQEPEKKAEPPKEDKKPAEKKEKKPEPPQMEFDEEIPECLR